MRYFLLTFPIHARMFWRRVLRFFGVNTYAMVMDDFSDTLLLLKINMGAALVKPIKEMIKDMDDG